MATCVWRTRTWPLRHLSEAQYAAWERDGFLVVPGVVPPDACAAAAATVRAFVGATEESKESWYANTQDIYVPSLKPRPAHGPCGMAQISHHATLWALRQLPAM